MLWIGEQIIENASLWHQWILKLHISSFLYFWQWYVLGVVQPSSVIQARLVHFRVPGYPGSNKVEHLFQWDHRLLVQTHMAAHRDQHTGNSACTTTNKRPDPVPFSDWSGWKVLMKNTSMYVRWIPPVTGLRHLVHPRTGSWSSGLHCCWPECENPWGLQTQFSFWYSHPLGCADTCRGECAGPFQLLALALWQLPTGLPHERESYG